MSGIPAGAGQLLGKRLGKFEIVALLALGGTAEIYLARIGGAAGFEKYVVVKCLHDHLADDAEFVKMFLDEARLAAHLDHSNIVQTMELGEHDGRYYMVMEFLAGLSLAMIVRRAAERLLGGRIPVPLVLNMLAQSCAGLHYAHEKAMNGKALNIVHRDISPQNLVISFEGVVKLVDFGIAKAELRETRTRSGTIKGKFAYMSPEQCVANNVDRRTDVFALGVIAHELLTGRRLFKRPSPYETYQAVMECDVKPPSTISAEIDPALDAVIMRAITKDRADRYPTAEAFGDALLGYLHHRGIGSGPVDVSRFFDAHFAQEIDEHSARMRELIDGRDPSVDTGVSWGDGDGEEERRGEPGRASSSGELAAASRQSSGSLSLELDDLGPASRDSDDDMPAERTRIETNPLERVNELERLMAAGSARPAGAPTPLKPPSSGKFPNLANVPTVIADPKPSGLDPGPGQPAALPAHARTQIAPLPAVPSVPQSAASQSGAPSGGSGPVPSGLPAPGVPHGYPVMNAQMSAQIATGATVFPSESRRAAGPSQAMAAAAPPPPPPRGAEEPAATGEPPGSPDLPARLVDASPFDAQHAAGLLSPVGPRYPETIDWGAVAARPARAVPPWRLAVLFLGAIGVALALTVVIARILH